MFATTKQFLDYFNLKSLQELPPLSEIKELSQSEQELDLADELAQQRVIDLPEEVTDEASFEQSDAERAQLLAEEEALELSKKPLDEILRMGMPESLLGEEADSDSEDEVVPETMEENKSTLNQIWFLYKGSSHDYETVRNSVVSKNFVTRRY